MVNSITVVVYGADKPCASCLHAPSSAETFEWIRAAIARKFPEELIQVEYVDIESPPEDEDRATFAERVLADEFFYPVVRIGEKVVGEGNPRLKTIFAELEGLGARVNASSTNDFSIKQ
ncbi:YuzD family protein [Bacillus fonticola]|uniref:YuzD family protein n=1 Tax=Bacillus fonticola TaxID=2728853 RepID=UPI0014733412|nr:DUF1462 family protein [Bacillus fonticola]